MSRDSTIIGIVIGAIVIAIMYPIAIVSLSGAGDTVVYNMTDGTSLGTLTSLADPAIMTLIEVLLPIIAIVGIIFLFIQRRNR